jgi:hypothetical protein
MAIGQMISTQKLDLPLLFCRYQTEKQAALLITDNSRK